MMARYKQTLDLCLLFKLWFLLGFVRYSTADCIVNTPGVQTFGSECQFMCHCKDRTSCDTTTGACDQGCASNWYGPACQYRDLAQGQYSRHNSNTKSPKYSVRAHDGETSTCSQTNDASLNPPQPWWRVWFSQNETIRDIYLITTGSGLQYFKNGYEVSIEYVPKNKKTDQTYFPPDKHICFKYNGGPLSSKDIHVKCEQPLVGNQVRIKLSTIKSQLSLCDVKINGGRNFAFRKPVSSNAESDDTSLVSSNAVDGRIPTTDLTGCFASRESSVNKNLDIDLERLYYIYSVDIDTNNNDRIRNYKLYDKTVGQPVLLHDDANNDPPLIYIHINRHVQQLRIEKNTGNYLDICELQLFGECPENRCGYDCSENCYCSSSIEDIEQRISGVCTSGCQGRWTGINGTCNIECDETKWGPSCLSYCGACRTGHCDVVSGDCAGGCQDGFYSYYKKCLTECQDDWYGFNCSMKCSEHCKDGKCNNTNGVCKNGCEPGYSGEKCDKECPDKTYGDKCSQTCNTQCIDVCNHVDGTCQSCAAGWKGGFCSEVCPDKTYGTKCSLTCNTQCIDVCNHVNGTCKNCVAGWIVCPDNTYGDKCSQTCNTQCIDVCNHVNGACNNCATGWKGDFCEEECPDNTYGDKCSQRCNTQCIDICNHVNGTCKNCTAGWKGDYCHEECTDKTYGDKCSQTCNTQCIDICDHVNGTCKDCVAGWKGDYCDEECDDGKYGSGCEQYCNQRCLNPCDKANGSCSQCEYGWMGPDCNTECNVGFYGIHCKLQCSDHCEDTCNKENGSCSCTAGWQGHTCHNKCDDGTHGDGCLSKCGNCKEGAACDKIDGSCIAGCAAGYEGSLCASQIKEDESSVPVAAIVGAIAAVVVIAIVVVVVVLILRRRKQSASKNQSNDDLLEGKEKNWTNVSSDGAESRSRRSSSKKDTNIYENSTCLLRTSDTSDDIQMKNEANDNRGEGYYQFGDDIVRHQTAQAIRVNELARYVKLGLAKENFFENEFQDIPYGLQYPVLDARRPENMGKNRYKAMYAYDHSRVKLEKLASDPQTDYINASYIKGYKKDRAYIAAQGPTVNNIEDFWRMIWENDVHLIAMVTNLVEHTKMKCLQYWVPVGGSKAYGKVTVFTETEEEFAEFSVRRFKISYEGSDAQKEVVHYIYTAWPDKDIPRSTSSLLHFWQKVRKHDKDKTKPWLVHCSAGVGRTGTFIALDYLYDQGIDTGYVDVNNCVRTLRDQRVNMVQMKEQYKYVYRIMVEALVLRSTPILLHEFDSHYADRLTNDSTTRKTKLEMDYESMTDEEVFVTHNTNEKFEEDSDVYANAKKSDNRSKNRYSNILAPDEYRSFLSTNVPGRNNYINAVYMPSYSDLHGYIVSQTPLPDTAVDCCRLVIEQEIHVIVTFDDDGGNEVGVYLPTTDSVEVGPFKVTFDSEQKKEGYVIRRHTFKFKSKEQTVVQFDYKDWALNTLVPKEPLNMLKMLYEVEELMRQFDNKPALAQCINGAERSGLFVVLMNAIERARTDEEVSIPQVIRFLRTRRQQIIPNYEQYKFCHDVILAYAESNAMYANM